MSDPGLLGRGTVVGVGVDLVYIPEFGKQLAEPGTQMGTVGSTAPFTAAELADAREGPLGSGVHLAARWAAKEALIKAWSAALYSSPPVAIEQVHRLIEVVTDAWGRPHLRLHGVVAEHLARHNAQVSLSHDRDYAIAFVTLSAT